MTVILMIFLPIQLKETMIKPFARRLLFAIYQAFNIDGVFIVYVNMLKELPKYLYIKGQTLAEAEYFLGFNIGNNL